MTDTLEAKKTTKAEAPARPAFPPMSFSVREFAARDYELKVPAGTQPEELLRPSIFAHFAKKLRSGSYLHVSDDGGVWRALFCVASAGETWAQVYPCWIVQIPQSEDGDPTPASERFKIDHIGSGWRVIQRETGKVLRDKLAQRADAEKFIQSEVGRIN